MSGCVFLAVRPENVLRGIVLRFVPRDRRSHGDKLTDRGSIAVEDNAVVTNADSVIAAIYRPHDVLYVVMIDGWYPLKEHKATLYRLGFY